MILIEQSNIRTRRAIFCMMTLKNRDSNERQANFFFRPALIGIKNVYKNGQSNPHSKWAKNKPQFFYEV